MKTNKEKFKAMTRKQKTEYIWEYYRFHILGTIVGIFLVGQFIYSAMQPKPDYDTHLIVTAMMTLDTEKVDEDENYFLEQFNTDIYYIPADWSVMDQATIVNDQLIMLKIQVREADVLAMSQERYNKYADIETFEPFMPLEDVPELASILEEHKDNLIIGKGLEDGKEHVYGIKVEESKALTGANVIEPLIISLIDPPKDIEKAVEVVKYLLQ